MTEGVFTLGRNASGQMIFVRVGAASIEIVRKQMGRDDAAIRIDKGQIAALIEVLK